MILVEHGTYKDGFKKIAEVQSEDELANFLASFFQQKNITPYYVREWTYEDDYTYYDYGSHTWFIRYKQL